jgi:hypothetical protein
MTVKLRGADYKAFMQDDRVWLEDYWFEDVAYTVDGVETEDAEFVETQVPDEAVVTVTGGCLYQGQEINARFVDYEKTLRTWLKARAVTTIVLEVANEHVGSCRQAFANMPGVRVLR